MSDEITEILPLDMPDWAVDAKAKGQFFNTALELVSKLERQVAAGNHCADCPYWTWEWEYSWDKTDCRCPKPETH